MKISLLLVFLFYFLFLEFIIYLNIKLAVIIYFLSLFVINISIRSFPSKLTDLLKLLLIFPNSRFAWIFTGSILLFYLMSIIQLSYFLFVRKIKNMDI